MKKEKRRERIGEHAGKGVSLRMNDKGIPSSRISVFVALFLVAWPAIAEVDIPAKSRAAILQAEINMATTTGDHRRALATIAELRELEVEIPPLILLLEAEIEAREGNMERAREVLDEFFAVADNTDEAHGRAQALQQRLAASVGNVRYFRDTLPGDSRGPLMVVVPPGAFTMGSHTGEDEFPPHTVRIDSPFAIGKYEITTGEFERFVDATGYRTDSEKDASGASGCHTLTRRAAQDRASWRLPGFHQDRDHPVVCVSWNDAKTYTQWLSEQTGEDYRLPSEAELEYVIRGGAHARPLWPNDASQCEYANLFDQTAHDQFPALTSNYAQCSDGYALTAPVGRFNDNPVGLADIIGNVWEWGEDCWHDDYAGAPTDGTPWTDTGFCAQRVIRGWAWDTVPTDWRPAVRGWAESASGYHIIGFRVARDL